MEQFEASKQPLTKRMTEGPKKEEGHNKGKEQ